MFGVTKECFLLKSLVPVQRMEVLSPDIEAASGEKLRKFKKKKKIGQVSKSREPQRTIAPGYPVSWREFPSQDTQNMGSKWTSQEEPWEQIGFIPKQQYTSGQMLQGKRTDHKPEVEEIDQRTFFL